MTRRAITLLALVCALSAGAPAAALAASGPTAAQAITDCNSHGRLTTHYSAAVLRQALAQMPADVREYTDCYDVIQRQLLGQLGAAGGAGGAASTSKSSGGSSFPVWLIVVIVLLLLAAITLGAMAVRRRSPESTGPGGPGPGASDRAGAEAPEPPARVEDPDRPAGPAG